MERRASGASLYHFTTLSLYPPRAGPGEAGRRRDGAQPSARLRQNRTRPAPLTELSGRDLAAGFPLPRRTRVGARAPRPAPTAPSS